MSGYIAANGSDLDIIFIRGSGATATGYLLSDDTDLSSRYLKNSSGVHAGTTGYTTSINGYTPNTDLSQIFEPIQTLFTYTYGGTLSYGVTINGSFYNFCIEYNEHNTTEGYACYITFNKDVNVNLFMCSPGGPSGYTIVSDNYTGPAGGGGGGIIDVTNVSLSKDIQYFVYFGTAKYSNSIFGYSNGANMYLVSGGSYGRNSNSGVSGGSGVGEFGPSTSSDSIYKPPYNKYTDGSSGTTPPDYGVGYGAGGASGSGNYGTAGGGTYGDGKGGSGYNFNNTVYATGGSGNSYSTTPESGYGFGGTPILNSDGTTYTSGPGYNGRIFVYFNYPT